jgi:hypothetical protein
MTSTASTLQDFPWKESIHAVKDSLRFDCYPDFAEHAFNTLPQKSARTRHLCVILVGHWSFPDRQLLRLPSRMWGTHEDEKIPRDVMRVCASPRESVVTAFIEQCIPPQPLGTSL